MVVAARPGKDLHQLDRGTEKIRQTAGGFVDDQSRHQVRLLSGDADRAVVGVARPHAKTTDRLDCGIRYRDGIRP